jgi:hypothetical protein
MHQELEEQRRTMKNSKNTARTPAMAKGRVLLLFLY